MSSWLQPLCGRKKCVKVCIECCACGTDAWYKVNVPIKPVVVVASKTGTQAYSSTATTVIYNTVSVNESSVGYNNCNNCNYNPCCCKPKKCGKSRCGGCKSNPCSCKPKKCGKSRCGGCKRKGCDGGCSSSSSSSSCSYSYNSCNPCRPVCPPQPCGPCGPCGPYPYQQYNPYGYGGCTFYDSVTGIATVPSNGGGYYVMSASIETDAINGFTAEIRVSGQVIASKTVLPGVTQAMLVANKDLYDYQQVSVVVYASTPANIIGGNLSITRAG